MWENVGIELSLALLRLKYWKLFYIVVLCSVPWWKNSHALVMISTVTNCCSKSVTAKVWTWFTCHIYRAWINYCHAILARRIPFFEVNARLKFACENEVHCLYAQWSTNWEHAFLSLKCHNWPTAAKLGHTLPYYRTHYCWLAIVAAICTIDFELHHRRKTFER